MHIERSIDQAKETTRRYAAEHFPKASVVLLAGSWAGGTAHADSDLDIVIIDETVDRVFFEGTQYGDWIVEVCAINPSHAESFFGDSARHRSAPIPRQVSDSTLVVGDPRLADRIRKLAIDALSRGPEPIPDADRLEARYNLTLLRQNLMYSPADGLPALAAYAHVQLSRTALDATRRWRAERKALRSVVMEFDPDLSRHLDDALADAIHGDPTQMIEACSRVLCMLGGPLRTYERFAA